MVWHFLTARSQARQREWERERARSNIENFEQYQSASAQCFFFGFAVAEAGCSCVWYSRPAMWIEGEFFQRPAEGFSVAAWRSEVLVSAWRSVWPVWHEAQRTCHMCFVSFLVSALKFGKHAFECMLDLHVLFVSGKAGGFRNVGTISHLESLRATAPRFSPALPTCWNRQLGIIGLVRKSTAIHVDNCCIASGKGTMPVYLIAFEMDLVSARCRSKRGSCWGVKKQGHFVTFCYFGAPALWSILFVLWCIKEGGMLWCLFKNSMAWNLLLPRQSPLLSLLNLRCTDRLQLWWYVDFWYDICDMYVIRIYFTCTVYMRFEIKLVFLKSLWLWLSWFLKYAFLQTDLYPLFKELKNPRKKQTTKLPPHQLGSFRMDVNFQIALCISPPDRGRWETLTSPGWLQPRYSWTFEGRIGREGHPRTKGEMMEWVPLNHWRWWCCVISGSCLVDTLSHVVCVGRWRSKDMTEKCVHSWDADGICEMMWLIRNSKIDDSNFPVPTVPY